MSLHYLVKLEVLVRHVLPLSCYRKKLLNLSHLNCGFQIHQIWIQSLLRRVETIEWEGVQNTHHWSGRTETATENGVGQAGSRCHFGSHSSVASSIAPYQWCMFCTPLAVFPRAVINQIQIWRIWRSQLKWDQFWGVFL